MYFNRSVILFLILCAWSGPIVCMGQVGDDPVRTLRIGTKEAPPFAINDTDGGWSGISIDLWNETADLMGLRFEFVERDLEGLLSGVKSGELDAGVSALTMTLERELEMDFSHPYFSSGLTLAFRKDDGLAILGLIRKFISWQFLSAVGALALVVLSVGFLVWLAERRKNQGQFETRALDGIGSGFWWSAVTMTTVGYGDKSPVTPMGRAIALCWMFASLMIVSGFTAAIASAITVGSLETRMLKDKEIGSLNIATVAASSGEQFARQNGLRQVGFPSIEEAVDALRNGTVEAVLYDEPILRYMLLSERDTDFELLPKLLTQDQYAIALPNQSQLREPLNQALLEVLSGQEWEQIRTRYLGASSN